jgi:hypothetical protein
MPIVAVVALRTYGDRKGGLKLLSVVRARQHRQHSSSFVVVAFRDAGTNLGPALACRLAMFGEQGMDARINGPTRAMGNA